MASLTQQTWVWANSRRWWRTGKPGILLSMGCKELDTIKWLDREEEAVALSPARSLHIGLLSWTIINFTLFYVVEYIYYIYIHTYVCIYIYISYMCVFVCAFRGDQMSKILFMWRYCWKYFKKKKKISLLRKCNFSPLGDYYENENSSHSSRVFIT